MCLMNIWFESVASDDSYCCILNQFSSKAPTVLPCFYANRSATNKHQASPYSIAIRRRSLNNINSSSFFSVNGIQCKRTTIKVTTVRENRQKNHYFVLTCTIDFASKKTLLRPSASQSKHRQFLERRRHKSKGPVSFPLSIHLPFHTLCPK